MISQATHAAIRFGAGLSARDAPPAGASALWDSLAVEAALPTDITPFATRIARAQERRALRRILRGAEDDDARDALRALNRADHHDGLADLRAELARLAFAPVGFHARLITFWANHFAAQARGGLIRSTRAAYVEDALRLHVMGSFADMLRAAMLHPVMLGYLDQARSAGPFSLIGRRGRRGLNENMARELLELHTLGVEAEYTQADVTQMARLLTGLTFSLDDGFHFDPELAEPGIIEIFGKRYGARPVRLEHILEALDDLAMRPETAHHLAGKLAAHFIHDSPAPTLIAHMAQSYLDAQGDLPALYAAMLEHPDAWHAPLSKTRAPLEAMAASLRALGLPRAALDGLSPRETAGWIARPLAQMGAPHEQVPSPAGHGGAAAYWVTPQRLAARIDWAMGLAQRLPDPPDPRDFVHTAMADAGSDRLRRAAAGAETRAQGVGLILAAPEFHRR